MKIDPETGVVKFSKELILRPGMTRSDVLSMSVHWEDWNIIDDIHRAFRAIIKLPNKGISSKTILIVYVGLENRPLAFWDVVPWDIADGTQGQREGKVTKRIRSWFEEMANVRLPLKREWGHVDAGFDPWNQTGGIVCNYRERFGTEEEWLRYKRENKY